VPVAFGCLIPLEAMSAPSDEWPAPDVQLVLSIAVQCPSVRQLIQLSNPANALLRDERYRKRLRTEYIKNASSCIKIHLNALICIKMLVNAFECNSTPQTRQAP